MRPASPGPTSPHAKDHDHERHRALCLLVVRSRGAPAAPGQGRPGGSHRPARADPLLDLADRRPWGRPRQAAGVAAGTNYRERDLELALLAGVQVGSIAAGMSLVGAWAERKRLTRVARAAADLAVRLTAAPPGPTTAAPSACWAASPCCAPCCSA